MTSSDSQPSPCGRCRRLAHVNDQALECEICLQWFHISCEHVNKTQYKCISDSSRGKGKNKSKVYWYCNTCDLRSTGFMRSLASLHHQQQELCQKLDEVVKEIEEKASREQVEQLENRIKEIENEKSKDQDKELEKLNMRVNTMEQKQDDKPNPGMSQSDPVEVIKEIKEQEMRKNNIIVYNVPESNSEDGAERSKQDREVIRELAKICKENWKKEDVVSAIRLGKRHANGRSRPLLIKLNSEEKKKHYLRIW